MKPSVTRSRIALALGLALTAAASTTMNAAEKLPVAAADNGGITLPTGFHATVVADDVGAMRFIAVAPNGDIYVRLRDKGIVALRDTDGDGTADTREQFGDNGGTGIAVHGNWLYYSTNDAVYRQKLAAGQLVPSGEIETIVSGLPDERQHAAKAFTFGSDGALYVEIGSPSNALGQPDRAKGAGPQSPEAIATFFATHGGIWRFDANRQNQTQADGFHYSTGHRHILALAWHPKSDALFAAMNGRDQLNTVDPDHYTAQDNAERVSEEMHIIREGANLGWPYTYYDPLRKQRMLGPEYGGNNEKTAEPGRFPDPLVAFPAHWAPMQMAVYTAAQFPEKYRGGAFICFHGSWNRAPEPQRGYNVSFVPFNASGMPTGAYEVFADGFSGRDVVENPGQARFRPNGVAVGPDGSLYVSASQGGRIWRIFYEGK